jgi:ABC-type molybdate transport system substrate-binding protein
MKKMLLLLFGALLALPLQAQPLLVAAASDLTHCIDELAAAFAKQVPGATVKISVGASGHFYAQIRNGAPFDVLLSADMDYPRQLARLGAAEGATLKPYAIGSIALWSLDPRLDPAASGMAVLRAPGVGGRYHVIPMTGLAPIEQGAIVTRHGAANPLAPRFVQFMGSPAARAILERNGFSLPPAND